MRTAVLLGLLITAGCSSSTNDESNAGAAEATSDPSPTSTPDASASPFVNCNTTAIVPEAVCENLSNLGLNPKWKQGDCEGIDGCLVGLNVPGAYSTAYLEAKQCGGWLKTHETGFYVAIIGCNPGGTVTAKLVPGDLPEEAGKSVKVGYGEVHCVSSVNLDPDSDKSLMTETHLAPGKSLFSNDEILAIKWTNTPPNTLYYVAQCGCNGEDDPRCIDVAGKDRLNADATNNLVNYFSKQL